MEIVGVGVLAIHYKYDHSLGIGRCFQPLPDEKCADNIQHEDAVGDGVYGGPFFVRKTFLPGLAQGAESIAGGGQHHHELHHDDTGDAEQGHHQNCGSGDGKKNQQGK